MDKLLGFIGLLKNAGLLAIGDEAVKCAVLDKKARVVLLSSDAAPNTRRRAENYTLTHGVSHRNLPSAKSETGAAVGRDSCAILAVCDAKSAAAIMKKLETERGN